MTFIETLLVANRGEIARRVIRTARQMGIRTVAVYSDVDAGALHVEEADTAYRLPGSTPGETYLRVDSLIDISRRSGADAVHPGYGFLSEDTAFARACADSGLTFVGPTPEVIDAMGSKVRAKRIMAQAGVPVLPWVELGPGETVDPDAAQSKVGYPLMVKASAGGGGRGMRVVTDPAELAEAVARAGAEAGSAFGDATVFLERYVERPRHIEVQILGDEHGNLVSLFERECSIQRRHQKIVEESPSPAVDAALGAELTAAAVAAGKALGYVGAGTVEFVLAPDGQFFFLEVNTRLQVEHPVTEMTTGLDLVRLQLEVAQGARLPAEVLDPMRRGHAIEVRIYAEDPAADFAPAIGELVHFELSTDGVRVDGGYRSGDAISPFYDAMLAKVIAWAETRDEAIRSLRTALSRSRIHGVATNTDYLHRVLGDPEFREGRTDTDFLVRRAEHLRPDPAESQRRRAVHLTAVATAGRARRRLDARVQTTLPAGWRNVEAPATRLALLQQGERFELVYRQEASGLSVEIDGEGLPGLSLISADPDLVVLEIDGARHRCLVDERDDRVFVTSALGCSDFDVEPRFPVPGSEIAVGALTAASPGAVVAVHIEVGQEVRAGDALLVLEAMKMQQTVVAPSDGVVTELLVAPGEQVDTGAVLVVLDDETSTGEAATGRWDSVT